MLNRNICTYYPDCGEERYKLFFNRMIEPRLDVKKDLDDLHILFCREGTVNPGETFQPNHFVPLLFHSHQQKRTSAAILSKTSTATKRQKLCAILPKKASKKPHVNISHFFNVAESLSLILHLTKHPSHFVLLQHLLFTI